LPISFYALKGTLDRRKRHRADLMHGTFVIDGIDWKRDLLIYRLLDK
jgi:hypothetical protein